MVLAVAEIFTIRQATTPRNTVLAMAIRAYAEVAVGETCTTCRNNSSIGHEGVEGQGCRDVNECVLWRDDAACFPGTCHNDVAPARAPAQADPWQAVLWNRDMWENIA